MSKSNNKLDYLKKYLSGSGNDENKKKKKRPKVKGNGMKIIDDDVDVSKMRHLENDELEILGGGEDAPVIVGIIDERPEHVKIAEHYSKDKWKVIAKDDGFNSSITVQDDREYDNKSNNKKDSDGDLSPLRNKKVQKTDEKSTREKYDSDISPVRKTKHKYSDKHNSDSDLSPVRQKASHSRPDSDSNLSPVRKKSNNKASGSNRKGSDSDLSPPRNKRGDKRTKRDSDSDISPVRAKNNEKSSNKNNHSNSKRKGSDSDLSPVRNNKSDKRHRQGSDSDISPPRSRHNEQRANRDKPRKSRWDSGSDKPHFSNEDHRKEETKNNSSSTRSRFEKETESRHRDNERQFKDKGWEAEPKRVERTLDGKKAGLQDARHLKEENQEFKRKEDELFGKLSEDLTGRHAKAVKRNLGKRETSEDREKQRQKDEKQKELKAKYDRWGKGIKQVEEHEAQVKDYLHESSKPLARYKDDKDLESSLKNRQRDGDPMLEYMRKKEKEKGNAAGQTDHPVYKGPFPPNRFNIGPGHRWDGVDRSNGHEKNYFAANSKRVAMEAEKYKWSTEDM